MGDCAVRAVSVALGLSWDDTYDLLYWEGKAQCDMPSSNSVWGAVLKKYGFTRESLPNECPDCYTFEDFAEDHPQGIYVLGTGNHTATVRNGTIYDSWDSRQEIPQYYWRKD